MCIIYDFVSSKHLSTWYTVHSCLYISFQNYITFRVSLSYCFLSLHYERFESLDMNTILSFVRNKNNFLYGKASIIQTYNFRLSTWSDILSLISYLVHSWVVIQSRIIIKYFLFRSFWFCICRLIWYWTTYLAWNWFIYGYTF